MLELDLKMVESRWREAFAQYEDLRRARLGAVVRSEWATRERYDLRPLFYQRYPGRGRVLKSRPESLASQPVEHGFDRQGRLVAARRHLELYPPIETYYTYDVDVTEAITFKSVSGAPVPGQVERLLSRVGLPERYAAFKLDGFGPGPDYRGSRTSDALLALCARTRGIIRHHETYEHAGDRIVRIHVRSEGYTPRPTEHDELVTYDESGRVEQIVLVGAGPERVLFRKRRVGQTVRSLAEEVRSRLVEAIPRVIARAGFLEPLYCVELWYRSADFHFPPVVIPGLEGWRQEILRGTPENWWRVWNPEVEPGRPFPPYPIADQEVLEACQRLEQEVHSREAWDLGPRVLRQVARDLTERDWSAIADVTRDFVVFAIDHEMDDLEQALRASVPSRRIEEWKTRGILG